MAQSFFNQNSWSGRTLSRLFSPPQQGMKFNTPYGSTPTQQQQQNIIKYPELSTPQGGSLGNYTRTAGMVQQPSYTSPAPQASNPTKPTGGSTGNVSGSTASNPYASNPDFLNRFEGMGDANSPERIAAFEQWQASQGQGGAENPISQEEQYINEMYQPSMDLLGGQESTLRNQYGQNQGYYNSMFDPQYQQLDTGRQSAIDLNRQNQDYTRQGQESAMDLAAKTYQDLQRRNQQMYGGASSAGQTIGEIQGRELQSNVNNISQATNRDLTTLRTQLGDIETNYTQLKSQIDNQKNQTMIELQQAFEQSLLAIDQQRAGISGSKATDKYNALREFNNRKQQLEDQSRQLMQQLGTQALSAQQQIHSAIAQYQAQEGQTPDLEGMPGMEYANNLPVMDQSEGGYNAQLSLKRRKELGLL